MYHHMFLLYLSDYYTFDIKAVNNLESNKKLYLMNLDSVNIYNNEELFMMWYQSRTFNRNFHFLTAMTKKTFDLINNLSYSPLLTNKLSKSSVIFSWCFPLILMASCSSLDGL